MVLTAYFALSPVTGLVCHRRLRKLPLANLTPASGRQDHTTSPSASARSSAAPSASTASRPAAVTIACRPSVGRDRIAIFLFLPGRQAKFGKAEIEPKMPLIMNGGDSVKMDLGGWPQDRDPARMVSATTRCQCCGARALRADADGHSLARARRRFGHRRDAARATRRLTLREGRAATFSAPKSW